MLHSPLFSTRRPVDKSLSIHTTCGGRPAALTCANTTLSTITNPYHYYYRCSLK